MDAYDAGEQGWGLLSRRTRTRIATVLCLAGVAWPVQATGVFTRVLQQHYEQKVRDIFAVLVPDLPPPSPTTPVKPHYDKPERK